MTWTAPHALDVLFSTEHGLIFWTPLLVLSLWGLIAMAVEGDGAGERRGVTDPPALAGPRISARWMATCLLAAFLSQVYVAGSVESWSVAGAFGQRRFLGLTLIFCVGLAAFLTRVERPAMRRAAWVAVAVAVWWNLGLIAQFGAGLMDRQRLELARNAYNTFVTIPARLPNLAYRYVFERSSFYRRHPPAPEP
jgi:hypothetical protein